jgi:BirA family biotin operon repressor/biotin-[acetyl-CoA-carboxylase] ligase
MMATSVIRRLAGTRFADVRWFDELDSTNTYLLGQAREGAADGVVVVADRQTAGRGRLGRRWVAPPGGSLLFSVLLRPAGLSAERAHLLTASMALAGAAACERLAGVEPSLKWPNDLVVGEKKLAGILAEADLRPGPPPELAAVVIGMGINVAWHGDAPPEVAGIAVALDGVAGAVVDRADLLVELLGQLERRLADLDGVAADYRARCTTLGRLVRVELAGEILTGRAIDITPEGHLVIDPGHGLGPPRAIAAGDVVHVR